MDDLSALLSDEKTLRCRSCSQWLAPIYGSVKEQAPFYGLSPRGIRMAVEKIADEKAHTYFECYGCEKQRKIKKAVFWMFLGATAGLALLYGEIRAGRLQVPW